MRLNDDTQHRGHAQTIRDIEQVYRGHRIAVGNWSEKLRLTEIVLYI